jgi:hypothetical protein
MGYKMSLKQSISHPELLVSEDGQIYYKEQRINQIMSHGSFARGPMIAFWHDGKVKHLSVARLVYEAFIKQQKLVKNDIVDFLDDDEFNVHASNLTSGHRKSAHKRAAKVSQGEPYSTWMNGEGEIFC